jgi:hypothetical protein
MIFKKINILDKYQTKTTTKRQNTLKKIGRNISKD